MLQCGIVADGLIKMQKKTHWMTHVTGINQREKER